MPDIGARPAGGCAGIGMVMGICKGPGGVAPPPLPLGMLIGMFMGTLAPPAFALLLPACPAPAADPEAASDPA